MEKLKAELAAQLSRASLLDSKRATAQIASDNAVGAQQKHMLAGDLNDERLSTKLQSAVDTAASILAGFATPIAALAQSIADTEAQLKAEQLLADRKCASEQLAIQTDLLEVQLGPWLTMTRDLAASAVVVGNVHYEAEQIGGYLRNAASQVETAVHVSVSNLRGSVAAILNGDHPIPRAQLEAATRLQLSNDSQTVQS